MFSIDRQIENKAGFQLLYSYFITTDELRTKFEGTMVWDSFSVGRHCLTREQLQQSELIEWTHSKIATPAFFYFLKRPEKQALMDSVKIQYLDEIEKLAAGITQKAGAFNAFHLRLGDFLTNYKADDYAVDIPRFEEYVKAVFPDKTMPVLAATDGLHEKELFQTMFPDHRIIFIDELIFDEYRGEYERLPYTDFNVVSILNQLICSEAETFIGTYRSTFTAIIHRLRQERYGKKDFHFFPDGKVARLLKDNKILPDRHGFFDWNRYSAFAEDHPAMAWMREWDHDLTSIDI